MIAEWPVLLMARGTTYMAYSVIAIANTIDTTTKPISTYEGMLTSIFTGVVRLAACCGIKKSLTTSFDTIGQTTVATSHNHCIDRDM